MELSGNPLRHPEFRLEQIDDELLLYHPGQTKILYCNPTASLVWQLCDGERTVEEIVNLLREGFPEASASIQPDVEATLRQFASHGAISFV